MSEILPETTTFLKDVNNFACFTSASYGDNVLVYQLSHNYIGKDNSRSWDRKCVIGSKKRIDCDLKFEENKKHLHGFTYRYVTAIFENHMMANIYSQIKNITEVNDTFHSYKLIGGVDYHLMAQLQKRFGCNIKYVPAYHNFSRPVYWEGNMDGKIYHNLGDQVGSASSIYSGPLSSHILNSGVLNFYDARVGVSFYTALPQKKPYWQAVLFVFLLNVWLPLIFAFGILMITFKTMKVVTSYWGIAMWLIHALTGKGTEIKLSSISNRGSLIVMGCWTLVAAVLSYAYAGALISILTSPALESPPETWQDLLDRNYALKSMTSRITGQNQMGSINHFEHSENGTVYKNIHNRLNTNFGGGNEFRNFHM